MNIGEVATLTGIPAKTIRYYESVGLVPAPARTATGYRDYGEQDIRTLTFVRTARSLGFPVESCRTLLALRDDDHRASADVRAVARAQLEEIELRSHELEGIARLLERLVECCPGDHESQCPILDALAAPIPDTATREPSETATAFLERFYGGGDARSYLHDDVEVALPNGRFRGAERLIAASAHATRAFRGMRLRRLIADGNQVAALCELELEGAVTRATVSCWMEISGDRVANLELVLDTAPFTAPTRASNETAIDPICGMTIDIATAPATLVRDGTTYYFCNPGCRDAFAAA